MAYQIKIVLPSPLLQPYIEYYKNVEMDSVGVFKCIPVAAQELYFNFKNIHLQSNGYFTLKYPHVFFAGLIHYDQQAYSYVKNDAGGGFVVVFKPLGIQKFFGISNAEFMGYAVDGENIFREAVEPVWHKLHETDDIFLKKTIVESFLVQFLNNKFYPNPLFSAIAQMIKDRQGMTSTGMISKCFNISPRTLQRKFRENIGMSPKEYLQIIRLNYALKLIRNNDEYSLTRISYLSGYYDQSHFIKDVKKICGLPPGVLKKRTEQIEKCDNRSFLKLS